MPSYLDIESLDHDLEALLPESVRELAEVIGLPASLRLLARWRGVTIRVPSRAGAPGGINYERLVETIGEELARKLIDYYAGEHLKLPRIAEAIREARNIAIRRDRLRGASVSDLALRYDVGERTIYYVLSEE